MSFDELLDLVLSSITNIRNEALHDIDVRYSLMINSLLAQKQLIVAQILKQCDAAARAITRAQKQTQIDNVRVTDITKSHEATMPTLEPCLQQLTIKSKKRKLDKNVEPSGSKKRKLSHAGQAKKRHLRRVFSVSWDRIREGVFEIKQCHVRKVYNWFDWEIRILHSHIKENSCNDKQEATKLSCELAVAAKNKEPKGYPSPPWRSKSAVTAYLYRERSKMQCKEVISFNSCHRFRATCLCKECPQFKKTVFESISALRDHCVASRHYSWQDDTKIWICTQSQCDYQSKDFPRFRSHISHHDGFEVEAPWICCLPVLGSQYAANETECGRKFQCKATLKQHILCLHHIMCLQVSEKTCERQDIVKQ